MKVFVGAPVRNRAWVLPRHINAIKRQKEVSMKFCYIVNDCEDNTEAVLQNYGIHYVVHNLNSGHGHVRGQYSYESLAALRNVLLDKFLESDCDYLFSCDTDIIIPDGSLKQLIEDDKDIVAMIIRNHPTIMAHNVMVKPHPGTAAQHMQHIPRGLFQCHLTGAVYLIKRKVIEAGVRYKPSKVGEDWLFCEDAMSKGFTLWADTRLQAIHAYDQHLDLFPAVER